MAEVARVGLIQLLFSKVARYQYGKYNIYTVNINSVQLVAGPPSKARLAQHDYMHDKVPVCRIVD